MTAGQSLRNPRLTGPGILVALVLTGLVIGGVLAVVLRSGPGSSSALATAPPSVEPSVGSPAIGTAAGAPSSSSSAASGSGASPVGASSSSASPTVAFVAPPSGTRARVDPTLLSILPPTVGGLAVREFPEAEQQAAAGPDLGRNVARLATAFVGDANGANWAYIAVVDLRPGAGTDAFYRDWRDTFDASACERAGGVAGHSTIVIDARNVERTNCGSGVRTYHVVAGASGPLISVSDFGGEQFGQQILRALAP